MVVLTGSAVWLSKLFTGTGVTGIEKVTTNFLPALVVAVPVKVALPKLLAGVGVKEVEVVPRLNVPTPFPLKEPALMDRYLT